MSTGALDEDLALGTIAAAVEAGVTVFDTAHAYGVGPGDLGENERLLARGIRRSGAQATARIVTKGGMARTGGAWVPDGRAKSILGDCEASLLALGGLAIDLFLLHAPDSRTPWRTSIRALARLLEEGMVARIGLSNVNRQQLDEALNLAPIAAVQVGLSLYDDRAIRGGVVERCAASGIAVLAHSPLGGPRRVGALLRDPALAGVAAGCGATPAEVALAWVLNTSPGVVAIPGARQPATARSAARAAKLTLDPAALATLERRFGRPAQARNNPPPRPGDGEALLVMGIPGAGKSRVAATYVAGGYVRLNRDERGGSLRELADSLERQLSDGHRRVVLDNTYLTRAARSYVVDAANRHRLPTRCVWVETPLAQAQVNVVLRLIDRFGRLPGPEDLRHRARQEPGMLLPTSQMRALRELEAPSTDEGFARVERVPFVRATSSEGAGGGVFVAAAALRQTGWERALELGERTAPHLVFDWVPDGGPEGLATAVADVAAMVTGPVESALCPHGGGPPACWCRPPLPGLPLAFARAHGVDTARSVLIGTGAAHRTLATTLGARYVEV